MHKLVSAFEIVLTEVTILRMATACFYVLCLSSCSHEEVVTMPLGVLTYYKYEDVADGFFYRGHTAFKREEICGQNRKWCTKGKRLRYSVFKSATKGKIVITSYDEGPEIQHYQDINVESYFFNTVTGEVIICERCRVNGWDYVTSSLSDGWIKNGENYISFALDEKTGKRVVEVIEFKGTYAVPRWIPDITPVNSKSYGYVKSPDDQQVAWFECSEKCELFWLNKDLTSMFNAPAKCLSPMLDVYWDADLPKIGIRYKQISHPACLDSGGKSYYPELQSRSDDKYRNYIAPKDIRPLSEMKK
jgi:hypothetical protein